MTLRVVSLVLWGLSFCALDLPAQDSGSGPRQLAPGVLKAFAPQIDARDSFTVPMALPELNAREYAGNFSAQAETLHGQTQDVIFFRSVWQYEFATLGLRQIKLSFRNADGGLENRHYWYLVYRIRDFGKSLTYDQVRQEVVFPYITHEVKIDAAKSNPDLTPRRFNPQIELTGWVSDNQGGYSPVSYRDQYLPLVAREIQKLEDKHLRLYDNLEIRDVEIPLSENESDPGVWGVAVWENVDPRLNYVSVYIRGITNAYRMTSTADGKIGVRNKTLQLNYWRPGDSAEQERDFVSFGVPLVDSPDEQIAITRRYQLPGPQIRAYVINELAQREVPVAEIDAGVSLEDFSSPATAELNGGTLPSALVEALRIYGYQIPENTPVETVIESSMWQFKLESGENTQRWVLKFEPQYWEKKGRGIRFIKSLDHLWIYR